MAIDPSLIMALQGPQPQQAPLFGVPPEHLQQMAGDLLLYPGTIQQLRSSSPAGFDKPTSYVGERGAPGRYKYFGPDPRAMDYFTTNPRDPQFVNEYIARRTGQLGGGGSKSFGMMHPSPGTLMRYFREQGLLPD